MESNPAPPSRAADRPRQQVHINPATGPEIRTQCRVIAPAQVDASTLARWRELEQRALQPNAFLSPNFILPAARHLTLDRSVQLVLVECSHAGIKSLIGVGIFERRPPTSRIPFPHLAAYRTDHTFTNGLLLDREYAGLALREYMDFFKSAERSCFGVAFHDLIGSDRDFELMCNTAMDCGVTWFEIDSFERPVLVPTRANEGEASQPSNSRLKNLRRRMNNLRKEGNVRWQVSDGAQAIEHSIGKFLELEHSGWKGAQGGSLLSRHGHGDFFRAMATQFLQNGQAFFTELLLDDQIISSTFNLTSANTGFAFKIAWHPAYEKFSPGILNELELLRASGDKWPHLNYIDSCAPPGSYLENFWKDRKTVVSGVFATTKLARHLASAREYLRDHKQKMRRWLQSIHTIILCGIGTLYCDACDFATTLVS